jgi:hypothetical protein
MYSLVLLRRAIAHEDQDAWAGFQQCLEETMLTWLHEHPSRVAVCQVLYEKDLVAQTFERYRQAAGQTQMAFETLSGVLVYLQASLHGAILDTLRTNSRPRGVLRPVPAQAGEPGVENQTDSNEIWEDLQSLLPSAREQRLAYLLYHCGLKSSEIIDHCSQEFHDVCEINRLRLNIMKQLLTEDFLSRSME